MRYVLHTSVVKNWQAANERRVPGLYRLAPPDIRLSDSCPRTIVVVP